jgi:hypothetical protein
MCKRNGLLFASFAVTEISAVRIVPIVRPIGRLQLPTLPAAVAWHCAQQLQRNPFDRPILFDILRGNFLRGVLWADGATVSRWSNWSWS